MRRPQSKESPVSSLKSFISAAVASSLLWLPAIGCSDASDSDGQGGEGGASSYAEPLYALTTLVWGDQETIGYVKLTNTLDPGDVSLSDAREFVGYATIAVADGQLLVATDQDATIQRFAIDDAFQWRDADALSLSRQGVTDAGFFSQYILRDQMAYAKISASERALWEPVEFGVDGPRVDPWLALEQDGLRLFANYNRTYFSFDEVVRRPFSYHDEDWFLWSDDSYIVSYDPKTHDEESVLEVPCPGLDAITKDEDGNLYYSNWEYAALHALVGTGAAPCVARLTPQGELDADFQPDLRSWTDGRPFMNFQYLRGGKAIAAVLHDELFGDDFDFAAELSDQAAFWEAYGLNYRLWMFDLNAETAEPVRGLPDGDIPPSYTLNQIDGRAFLMLEATDFSKTTVYEIGLDGEATEQFEVRGGSSYQWIRVR